MAWELQNSAQWAGIAKTVDLTLATVDRLTTLLPFDIESNLSLTALQWPLSKGYTLIAGGILWKLKRLGSLCSCYPSWLGFSRTKWLSLQSKELFCWMIYERGQHELNGGIKLCALRLLVPATFICLYVQRHCANPLCRTHGTILPIFFQALCFWFKLDEVKLCLHRYVWSQEPSIFCRLSERTCMMGERKLHGLEPASCL